MAEGTRAYRRIGTRDPAAQRLARTLAATETNLTNGRRDRLLFHKYHNLWGGRWARVFGGGGWHRGWGAGSSEERGQIIAGYLHEAGPEAREEYLAGVRRGLADTKTEHCSFSFPFTKSASEKGGKSSLQPRSEPSEQRSTPACALWKRAWRPSTGRRALVRRDGGGRRLATAWTLGSGETCEW